MKTNTNKKIILFLIILIVLLFLSILIFNTYAKYLSSASSSANVTIAKWNIKVNDLAIQDNTDISSLVVPVFPGNDNIASNIIAPTAEGYFDLELDLQNVDVSFNYTITSTVDENSSVKDFSIVGYSIDDGNRIDFQPNDEKIISEDILLNSNIQNRNIRIYIEWIDDESQTMDNSDDTIAAISSNPAIFNVNINFSQIIG